MFVVGIGLVHVELLVLGECTLNCIAAHMSGRSSHEWDPEDDDGTENESSWDADADAEMPVLADNSDDEGASFEGWFDCEETNTDTSQGPKRNYHKSTGKLEAESRLGEMLVNKLLEGPWHATDICEIAYYVRCIGARSDSMVGKLSRAPGDPSRSNYSRHCKKTLKIHHDEHMKIQVAAFDKHEPDNRGKLDLAVRNIHEVINDEVADDPTLVEKLAKAVADRSLPDVYFEHPVATASSFTAFPILFYIDGVPTTKSDGVVGFWAYIGYRISDNRHLLCSIRKSRLCRCGCKGWCTLDAIWRWLLWSFIALATKVFPSSRVDRSLWGEDSKRQDLVGTPMVCAGACCGLKTDWMELGTSFWVSIMDESRITMLLVSLSHRGLAKP